MGIIHLSGGNKGGVGKTFLAKVLYEYLLSIKATFYLYDLDAGNHDVGKVYVPDRYGVGNEGDDAKLQFSDNRNSKDEVDAIFAKALEQDVLINLPSNIKHLYNPWIEDNGLIDLAKETGVKFVYWSVCNGEQGSINEFIDAATKFKSCDHYRHVFVQNLGLADNWEQILKGNQKLREIIEADKIITMDLPDLSPTRYKKILDNQLTFAAALDSQELNLIDQQSVKKFLEKARANLDAAFIGLGLSQPAEAKKK